MSDNAAALQLMQGRSRLLAAVRNIISFRMAHDHAHHRQPAAEVPGWSLLQLSAGQRLGLALGVLLVLWAATFAVIA
jgi:hypothetical protein